MALTMFWFGKKKEEEQKPAPVADVPDVELLLTEVSGDRVVLKSCRTYPLNVRLYLNATAPTIENVKSTGLEVYLEEARKVGRTTKEYRGTLRRGTPALIQWLQQVRDQGAPSHENLASYVSLHLDQRLERRTYRQFQVMSPDIPGYKGLTCDVSRTGMRLQVPESPPQGTRLRLHLHFDDFNFEDVEVTGEVLWVMERDRAGFWIGVRFMELTDKAREVIGEYMDFADGYKRKRFRGA